MYEGGIGALLWGAQARGEPRGGWQTKARAGGRTKFVDDGAVGVDGIEADVVGERARQPHAHPASHPAGEPSSAHRGT